MPNPAQTPEGAPKSRVLTESFDQAIRLAHDFHRTDVRKGTEIPYISHLLQVAGLVVEAGGDEAQAIAALLHDAIEDADGAAEAASREQRIRETFGDRVARIVLGCTDGDPAEKADMTWEDRKRRYLRHLRDEVDDDVLLVSVADKLHNARAILRDYRAHGEELWNRFNGGKRGTLRYYRRLVDAYRTRGFGPYVDELDGVVAALELQAVRGSRKHVLNWLESPRFLDDLNAMLQPSGATVSRGDLWQPRGWLDPAEAKLDMPLAERTGGLFDSERLQAWWLAHPGVANVPNWDLVSTCRIDGRTGLVLVEAKAHENELSGAGKRAPTRPDRSEANHQRIGDAIEEARLALRDEIPGIRISRDVAYQFSNRVAHAWWLARHARVPVVLLYLGFVGDDDMPKPFATDDAWQARFRTYAQTVMPDPALERRIPAGEAHFTILPRSIPVPADQRHRFAAWAGS
jgi:hypothetical protein